MGDPVPQDTLYIPQGGQFLWSWPLLDADTGEPADTTGWSARCEIKDSINGSVIQKFHQDRTGHSGWNGVITFDDASNLVMTLDATYTAALSRLPKTARFDVEMLEPTTRKPWRIVGGPVVVTLEVTTDA